jgi:hypothetical protein
MLKNSLLIGLALTAAFVLGCATWAWMTTPDKEFNLTPYQRFQLHLDAKLEKMATTFRFPSKQRGFVLLSRNYAGYLAGQIVELPTSTEAALVASGGASISVGPATAGPLATNQQSGAATILAGQLSVVITNPIVNIQSVVYAVIAQATADTTALQVVRVVAAAGSFTVFVNAAATANTAIDWAVLTQGPLSFPT